MNNIEAGTGIANYDQNDRDCVDSLWKRSIKYNDRPSLFPQYYIATECG